jgi:ribosome-associated protein
VRVEAKEHAGRAPYAVEGETGSGWVLMDYGDVIVHLFLAKERAYYDLEGFWKQASVLLSIQ